MAGKIQIINPKDLDFTEEDGMQERKLANKASGSSRVGFEHAIIPAGLEAKGVVYEGQDELVYFIKGKAEIGFDGQKKIVEPGGFFLIPDGVPYDFKVLEGPIEAVAAFGPPRD